MFTCLSRGHILDYSILCQMKDIRKDSDISSFGFNFLLLEAINTIYLMGNILMFNQINLHLFPSDIL